MTKSSIYDAVIFNDCAPGRMSPAVFNELMKRETIITLKNGAFSGVLQIMGLASAMNCTIQMIYPDKKHRLYALLNGTFKPLISPSSAPVITIMWTNMSGWPNQSYTFTANHFVPLLPVINYNNTWSVVSSKRKRKRSPSEKCTMTTTKKPSPRFFSDFVPAARKRTASPLKKEISPQKNNKRSLLAFALVNMIMQPIKFPMYSHLLLVPQSNQPHKKRQPNLKVRLVLLLLIIYNQQGQGTF